MNLLEFEWNERYMAQTDEHALVGDKKKVKMKLSSWFDRIESQNLNEIHLIWHEFEAILHKIQLI